MPPTHYNLAVIGSGPGGYVAALRSAAMGARTAIIEKSHLGGTCLNWGCIPSKALLSSAELVHQLHHSMDWGVKVGSVSFDWPAIQKRKDKVLQTLRGGIASLLKGRQVTHYQGTAKLDGPGRIAITPQGKPAELITADQIILATGSVPIRIPNWPTDPQLVCTSDEAVHWDTLPKELLIVGGGVIGCEFACMMQPLGVKVTIVELLPHLLPGMDRDLGEALLAVFKKRGITVHLNTKVNDMKLDAGLVSVQLSNQSTLSFDRVLVSVGRAPNTKNLGLDSVNIETSPKGFIKVDDTMRTPVAGYFCIGDANGKCLLAHAASAHGVCAVDNALGHHTPFVAPIPGAVYTFPEIAGVGMTEAEAREKQLPISIGKFPLGHLGKAMACNHTEGFVKVIRHRESDALLGVHMLGHNATEYISAAGTMLHQRATTHELAEVVFAHPTLSEAIKEAAEDALHMGLHLPPRKVIRVPALV